VLLLIDQPVNDWRMDLLLAIIHGSLDFKLLDIFNPAPVQALQLHGRHAILHFAVGACRVKVIGNVLRSIMRVMIVLHDFSDQRHHVVRGCLLVEFKLLCSEIDSFGEVGEDVFF
jgi:hypothetical protein